MSFIDTAKQRLADLRERRPFIDHVVRTIEHYGAVNGSAQAAAVTYFAFLSFFPIIALAFAVIGFVSRAYPNADDDLITAISDVLPGIVGGEGGLQLSTFQDNAPGILSVGLVLALYSGLGWLSGLRAALIAVFEEPEKEKPNFLFGKIRDVLALVSIGTILLGSVAVSGVATKLTTPILDLLGLGAGATPVIWVLGLVLGFAANMVLFFAFFRLLAAPHAPTRSLWSGALLGAIGFELLKQLSTFLLAGTKEQPAAQAFGIALILIVWMNYFSRLVVLSAAWAHTSAAARALRPDPDAIVVEGPRIDLAAHRAAAPGGSTGLATAPAAGLDKGSFAAGAGAMLALVAVLRRKKH